MDDAQKIALIASFLLRYPDESWYNELGEWKEDTRSVEHPQTEPRQKNWCNLHRAEHL